MSETNSPSSANAGNDEQTEVGNYFISNYPPYSFWSPEKVPLAQDVLASKHPGDYPLGIYFHIPFCRKRCHFCYFRVYTDKNAAEITNSKESRIFDLTLCNSFVKITIKRFFMKNIAETMKTSKRITSKFDSISCKTW